MNINLDDVVDYSLLSLEQICKEINLVKPAFNLRVKNIPQSITGKADP